MKFSKTNLLAKRAIDVVISSIVIFFSIPLIIVIGILIRIKLGAPILFKQERPGKDAFPFEMYKFRSMSNERDAHGNLKPDSERLTRFGCMLRSSSIDELPELWSVLKGEMSLVGPRPLLMEYLPLYSADQFRRHSLRPGITGWAQINGRNAISWDEKFRLDIWYVDNFSFLLDLKIIAITAWKIIVREGISHGEEVTMPRFLGERDGMVAK
jgi:sugar transferase EpsL